MRRLRTVVILLLLFLVSIMALGRATEEKTTFSNEDVTAYVMPSRFLKIATLDFDGLVSDFMLLKALVFIGGASERHGSLKKISGTEWTWIYALFDAATELDPYFFDPYYFANAYLTWEAGIIRETNTLLDKGSRSRTWDWMTPFFIGFNHFYFLHEDDKASGYLMEASRRPGANPSLASLAAKLAYKGKRTETAIFFLEEILNKTEDETLRKQYETRIQALRTRFFLEQAVALYKEKHHKIPQDLDALLKKGIIKQMPRDPFGGTFSIDAEGGIKTTSDEILLPRQK